jgi:DNA-binding MarR family transcriptional regulator
MDNASLASQLERRVARLMQRMRADARGRLSVASLLTLRRLEDEGPMRITDLAAAELVAQPSMTGLVTRLEHEGLVERTPDPDDARAVRVALTDAGRSELATVRAARAAAMQERLDALDPEARAALLTALPALEALTNDPRTR